MKLTHVVEYIRSLFSSLLCDILLYQYVTIYSPILLSMGIWYILLPVVIMIEASINILVHLLVYISMQFCLVMCPGVEFMGQREFIHLTLAEMAKHLFQSVFTYLHSCQRCMSTLSDLCIHQHIVMSIFLIYLF